jgi:hypothetical protein
MAMASEVELAHQKGRTWGFASVLEMALTWEAAVLAKATATAWAKKWQAMAVVLAKALAIVSDLAKVGKWASVRAPASRSWVLLKAGLSTVSLALAYSSHHTL